MFKKSLSVLLAVVMMLSVFTTLPFTVNAADTDAAPTGAKSGITGGCTWTLDDNSVLTISGNGKMEDYSFSSPWRSYSFNTVVIENGVTSIGGYAFDGCAGLTRVTIPNSVTRIGEGAFYGCTGLTSVTIGNSVTSIGVDAFRHCSRLTSVTIPDSVTSIGNYAFRDTAWYDNQPDGLVYAGKVAYKMKGGCPSEVVIKDGTLGIASDAFSGCTGLKIITIPDSVTSIGNGAFSGCTGLTSVTIPDSVTSIGNGAFSGCTGLTSVTIPDSVTSIGNNAFEGCTGLTSVDIPDSVTSIGRAAFEYCKSLTSVTIPDSVTSIDRYAFYNCTGLTSVTIPDSVTSICDDAFYKCTGLTSVTIPDSVTNIGDAAFSYCRSLTDVYYGGSESDWEKIKIGDNNTKLTDATIHYNSTGPADPSDPADPTDAAMYCKGKKISGIDVSFNKNLFFKSSASYDHDIATLCSQMLLEGYIAEDHGAADLTKSLSSLGFDNIEMNLDAGRDQMNYFIASKHIKKSGETYDLIFVGCIGSWHEQWNSNFDPKGHESDTDYAASDTSYQYNHYGFNDAKNYIYNKLKEYINAKGFSKSNTKILLTGHSRGAATANLLAAKLIDYTNINEIVSPENLFTYTFATPNCTKDNKVSDPQYSRIFNIVLPTDFVTKVLPAAWRYGRYGTTYTLPSVNNDKHYYTYYNKMKKYYDIVNQATSQSTQYNVYLQGEKPVYDIINTMTENISGLDDYYYKDFKSGLRGTMTPYKFIQAGLCNYVNKTGNEDSAKKVMENALLGSGLYRSIALFFGYSGGFATSFQDNHKMETYCAFMMGLSSKEVTDGRYRKGYKGIVNCPVDVEVIDKSTGEVVGRIVNNVVDEEIAAKENSVVMTVEGDQKEYWLPYNGDYEVRLTGNDDGVMDYTLSKVDPDLGETERKNYYDIPLEKDREYVCAAESADPENSPELEDFTLTGSDDIEITPDESFTAEDAIEYTVTTETAGSGSADTVTVTSGDYATLSAVPVRSEFIGWYENDTLISKEAEYRFRPTSDLTLTAKFTEMEPLMLGDTDGDDDVTVFDAVCLQRNIADILTTAFFEQAADTDGDGEVTLMDATYIQRWLIHSKSNDNIGKLMK